MRRYTPYKRSVAGVLPPRKNIYCHALPNWIMNCGNSAHFSSYPILMATPFVDIEIQGLEVTT